jgi:phage major head subunit gpT-like protein
MPVNLVTLQTAEIQSSAAFLRGLQSVSTPIADRIAMTVPMNTKVMEAPVAQMIGPMREWSGPRMVEKVKRDGMQAITAKDFEKTVSIPRTAIDDDNTGAYMAMIETLGAQARALRDQQICTKLEAGETDLCYDGLAYFSASHVVERGDSRTYSNLTLSGSPAWYLFDTTKGTKPMVWGNRMDPEFVNLWNPDDWNVFNLNEYVSGVYARGCADYGFPQLAHKCKGTLDATNFEAALVKMTSLINSAGENLQIRPNVIVVPPILEPAAIRLFKTRILASGADNIHFGEVEVIVGQRLSNS